MVFCIGAILLPGCLALPIPSHAVYEGREIDTKSLGWLQSGVTTRSEVLGHLGDPDVYFVDEHVYGYSWAGKSADVLVVIGMQGSEMHVPMRGAFLVQFNEADKVIRYGVVDRPAFAPLSLSGVVNFSPWTETVEGWLSKQSSQSSNDAFDKDKKVR